MNVVWTAYEFLSSTTDQYERPLFLVYRKSFVSTMITLKHIAARFLSSPCYEESLRLYRPNVLDGASYVVTELCVHRRPLVYASCKCLLFTKYSTFLSRCKVKTGPGLLCPRCRQSGLVITELGCQCGLLYEKANSKTNKQLQASVVLS